MDDAQGGALSWPAFREAIPLLAALQWPPRLRWSLLRSRVLAADVPGALCAECVVDVPATEKLAAAMDGLMGGEEHGGSDSEGGAVAVDAPDVSSVVPRRRRVVHVRLCAAFSATFSAPWLLVSACDTGTDQSVAAPLPVARCIMQPAPAVPPAGAPVPNPQLAALLEPMLRPSEACPIHAMLTEEVRARRGRGRDRGAAPASSMPPAHAGAPHHRAALPGAARLRDADLDGAGPAHRAASRRVWCLCPARADLPAVLVSCRGRRGGGGPGRIAAPGRRFARPGRRRPGTGNERSAAVAARVPRVVARRWLDQLTRPAQPSDRRRGAGRPAPGPSRAAGVVLHSRWRPPGRRTREASTRVVQLQQARRPAPARGGTGSVSAMQWGRWRRLSVDLAAGPPLA